MMKRLPPLLIILMSLTISSVFAENSKISETNVSQSTTEDAWFTLDDVVQTAFSPDGRYLAVRTSTHFQVYDMQQTTPTIFIETEADSPHYNESPIAFSLDGQFVSINIPQEYPSQIIRVWNMSSGEVVGEITQDFFIVVQLNFSPTEPLLLISHRFGENYYDGVVTAWEFEQDHVRYSFRPGSVAWVTSISPNGEWALVAGSELGGHSELDLYNLLTNQVIDLSSGQSLYFACECDTRPTWDYAIVTSAIGFGIPRFVITLPDVEVIEIEGFPDFEDFPGLYFLIDWSFDGTLLAVQEPTGRVRIIEFDTGHQWSVGVSISPTERLPVFAFHPSQNIIALYYGDDSIELWDAENGEFLRALIAPVQPIRGWSFSSDGRYMIGTDADYRGDYYLWDIQTGEHRYTFETIEGETLWNALSPNGNLFLVHQVFSEGQLWVWRLDESEA